MRKKIHSLRLMDWKKKRREKGKVGINMDSIGMKNGFVTQMALNKVGRNSLQKKMIN